MPNLRYYTTNGLVLTQCIIRWCKFLKKGFPFFLVHEMHQNEALASTSEMASAVLLMRLERAW